MGSHWSDLDIYEWINQKFMLSDTFNFRLLSSSGRFAVERHEENIKDVSQLQKTVETLGVGPELRNPPWLVQHPPRVSTMNLSASIGGHFCSGDVCHAHSRLDFRCCKILRVLWKLVGQRIYIKKKETVKWTLSSLGAAGLTTRKFEVANDPF